MRRAQVVVYETEGRLAEWLRALGATRGWWLRPVRNPARVLNLLRPGEASVVVLKIGRDLEREYAVLERIHRLFPQVATVVVGETDQPMLAGLAWELGACFVLFPPLPRELLAGIVSTLMGSHE
jgi:DNA-binding NtrC family response regulator